MIGGGGGAGGTANNVAAAGDGGRYLTGTLVIAKNVAYTVEVGAGGTGGAGGLDGNASSTSGGDTKFATLTAAGGLAGQNTRCCPSVAFGGTGGTGKDTLDQFPAGGTGGNQSTAGVSHTFYGSTFYGYGRTWSSAPLDTNARAPGANTGEGGQSVWSNGNRAGGAGGSGVLILRYDPSLTANFTAGVTSDVIVIGGKEVRTIQSTTDSFQTVTFTE
jgi:hypothetical protein